MEPTSTAAQTTVSVSLRPSKDPSRGDEFATLYSSPPAALSTHPHSKRWPEDARYVVADYKYCCDCIHVSIFPSEAACKPHPDIESMYQKAVTRQARCPVSPPMIEIG